VYLRSARVNESNSSGSLSSIQCANYITAELDWEDSQLTANAKTKAVNKKD